MWLQNYHSLPVHDRQSHDGTSLRFSIHSRDEAHLAQLNIREAARVRGWRSETDVRTLNLPMSAIEFEMPERRTLSSPCVDDEEAVVEDDEQLGGKARRRGVLHETRTSTES